MVKVYLRIGKTKTGYKVSATNRPNHGALDVGVTGANLKKHIPTILMELELKIPDNAFEIAKSELELNIQNYKSAIQFNVKDIEEAKKNG